MTSEKKSGSSIIGMKKRIEEISNGRYLIYYSFNDSKLKEPGAASSNEKPMNPATGSEGKR